MSTPAIRCSAALVVIAAVALSACGGDGEDTTAGPVTAPPHQATAPQSAGETVAGAPDQSIEDRPGGPGDSDGQGSSQSGGTRAPSASDERLIESAVRRYIAALNAHDGEAVCGLLAPRALDGVSLPERRGSCAASLDASIGHPSPRGAPRWVRTQLVSADSVVLVKGGDGRLTGTVVHRLAGSRQPSIEDDVVYLRKIGGRWLIVKPSATFYRAIGAKDVPLSALTPPN
jgi:hypothetical protein